MKLADVLEFGEELMNDRISRVLNGTVESGFVTLCLCVGTTLKAASLPLPSCVVTAYGQLIRIPLGRGSAASDAGGISMLSGTLPI
jgi:hypothetical protein